MITDFLRKHFTTDSEAKSWSPVRRTFVENEEMENTLLDKGYTVPVA